MCVGKTKMHCVKCKSEFIPIHSRHKYCKNCRLKQSRMNLLFLTENAFKGTFVETLGKELE